MAGWRRMGLTANGWQLAAGGRWLAASGWQQEGAGSKWQVRLKAGGRVAAGWTDSSWQATAGDRLAVGAGLQQVGLAAGGRLQLGTGWQWGLACSRLGWLPRRGLAAGSN